MTNQRRKQKYVLESNETDILGVCYMKLEMEEFDVLGSAILTGYYTGVFSEMRKTSGELNKVSYII